jgi:hypothetical protein
VCNTGSLERKWIYRMSTPVVIIGWIILLPCILGMLFVGLVFFAMAENKIDCASSIPVFFLVAFFVAGLIGCLLVMEKHVLQCGTCGALSDAAALRNQISAAAPNQISAAAPPFFAHSPR